MMMRTMEGAKAVTEDTVADTIAVKGLVEVGDMDVIVVIETVNKEIIAMKDQNAVLVTTRVLMTVVEDIAATEIVMRSEIRKEIGIAKDEVSLGEDITMIEMTNTSPLRATDTRLASILRVNGLNARKRTIRDRTKLNRLYINSCQLLVVRFSHRIIIVCEDIHCMNDHFLN